MTDTREIDGWMMRRGVHAIAPLHATYDVTELVGVEVRTTVPVRGAEADGAREVFALRSRYLT